MFAGASALEDAGLLFAVAFACVFVVGWHATDDRSSRLVSIQNMRSLFLIIFSLPCQLSSLTLRVPPITSSPSLLIGAHKAYRGDGLEGDPDNRPRHAHVKQPERR